MKSRKIQIPALLALHFFVGFVFWYGIEKIFLSDSLGVGPTAVSAIVILYMVLIIVLDVPASVIADRWGRKRMLVLAVVLFIIANVVLGMSHDFIMYMIGTGLWALYTVSYEGTYEALLFDSLKAENREKSFQKLDAWSRVFFMVGIAISSIASGFLAAHFGLREVYFLSIIPLVGALGMLLLIREPKVHTDDEEAEDVVKRGYFSHLLHAFKIVWRTPKLRVVMFAVIALFFIQTPLYEFAQYIYIELFTSPVLVGICNGIAGFVLALGFFIAIKKQVPSSTLLLIAGVAITIMALLMNSVALVFLAVALAGGSMLENALQTELQHSTSSRTRASVTSAVYFLGNILIVPFAVIFGLIAEHNSIWQAYLLDGVIVVIMAIAYFALYRRQFRTAP